MIIYYLSVCLSHSQPLFGVWLSLHTSFLCGSQQMMDIKSAQWWRTPCLALNVLTAHVYTQYSYTKHTSILYTTSCGPSGGVRGVLFVRIVYGARTKHSPNGNKSPIFSALTSIGRVRERAHNALSARRCGANRQSGRNSSSEPLLPPTPPTPPQPSQPYVRAIYALPVGREISHSATAWALCS